MSSNVVPFPSCGPTRNRSKRRLERTAPARNVVKIVRLDLALCQDENPAFGARVGIALSLLVAPHSADRAAQLVGKTLQGPPLLLSPVSQLHPTPIRLAKSLPKWLYETLALWQYANMANGQIVYIRRVANDDSPPNRIQELLDARGMSQADLARVANVTPSALNKVLKGTRGLDQEWLRRLAPHLGVTPAELLPVEDNPLSLSQDEKALLARYRAADRNTRAQLSRVSEALTSGSGSSSSKSNAA